MPAAIIWLRFYHVCKESGCMLFHYHYWTPHVEETERFYRNHGFDVSQRIGNMNGEFQSFNPPMEWDDFRHKNITFRIVEMVKGNVNITIGHGNNIKFDHLGFLVSTDEQKVICENARKLDWNVQENERRTFIDTPYGFKIELQTHTDVVEGHAEKGQLEGLVIGVAEDGLLEDLSILFNDSISTLSLINSKEVKIVEAYINGFEASEEMDPNGVLVINKSELY